MRAGTGSGLPPAHSRSYDPPVLLRRLTTPCALALPLACGSPGDPSTATGSAASSSTTHEATGTSGTSDTSGSSGLPTSGDATDTGGAAGPPRLNHLQALGTHNSYHLSPGALIKDLDYTHRPLDEQLGEQGVRHFELDLHFDDLPADPIAVFHLEVLDTGSTCATLVDCLTALKTWSDAHPAHHPLYVMLEVKTNFVAELAADRLAALEDQILAVWPQERLIVPDQIQGAAADLRQGLAAAGWPPIDDLRGRLLLVLHDEGAWRDAYTAGGTTTAGRLLFPDAFGDLDLPFAAVHSINDPFGGLAAIEAAVDAGHLVRTRADADNVEPSAGDDARQIAALASGAHFISTDYPPPKGDKYDYVCEIPGGTPSRCNPRSAPPGCTAEAIEDPGAL